VDVHIVSACAMDSRPKRRWTRALLSAWHSAFCWRRRAGKCMAKSGQPRIQVCTEPRSCSATGGARDQGVPCGRVAHRLGGIGRPSPIGATLEQTAPRPRHAVPSRTRIGVEQVGRGLLATLAKAVQRVIPSVESQVELPHRRYLLSWVSSRNNCAFMRNTPGVADACRRTSEGRLEQSD